MPPRLGCKPRTYCSAACCRASSRPPKPTAVACTVCGRGIPQKAASVGRRRKVCSKECRKLRKAKKPTQNRACLRCGKDFASANRSKYCTDECRYPKRPKTMPCEACGKSFRQRYSGGRFCSVRCSATLNAERNRRRAKIRQCLCCEKAFRKKFNGKNEGKFCSRECAFRARRLKMKCAERPLEVASKLSSWFLSWGDDRWPVTSVCQPCGGSFVSQRNENDAVLSECRRCRDAAARESRRKCSECGGEIKKGRQFCDKCADKRKRSARNKNRRAHRKRHGHATTFRKRCRKYGAPYTSVCKEAVMSRGKWKCQLCGVKLLRSFATIVGTRTPHPRSPTIDHIVPLSFGPSSPGHVLDNCQAACWQCNWQRGVEDANSFALRKTTVQYS